MSNETTNTVAAVLGLLAVVICLVEIARRFRVPYPVLMVLAGLGASFIPGLPSADLHPDLVFIVFLPPILYAAAWDTSWNDFRRNLRPILMLALGLVFVTTLFVGWVAHEMIGLEWSVAFLLGAIVSPPDAAAATAICRRLNVPARIVTIIEGESLINDAAGLVAYRVALAAVLTETFSLGDAAVQVVLSGVGGVLVGLALGALVACLHWLMRDALVTTALSLLAPFVTYMPAEMLHVSGVLAVVTAGLLVSWLSPRIMTPDARLTARPVWEIMILLLNGALFVLIGMQVQDAAAGIEPSQIVGTLAACAIVCLAVIVIRFAWVFAGAISVRKLIPAIGRSDPMPPAKALVLVSWMAMRGVVSLAAVLALPAELPGGGTFPHRDLLVLLVFSVILVTLVAQSLTTPWLIRRMRLRALQDEHYQEVAARVAGANAAMEALDNHCQNQPAAAPLIAEVRKHYENQDALARAVERAGPASDASDDEGNATCKEVHAARALWACTRAAEREALLALRKRGWLSDTVFRRLERELDIEDVRLR